MNIEKLLAKDKHKQILEFAYTINKYDKILLEEFNANKFSYEEMRDKITNTFTSLRTFHCSLYEYFYRQLTIEQMCFSTFDGLKQEYQQQNPNEDTSGSFVESYIMSALDREAVILTKQSFNRFMRTFFLTEAYRMKPLTYLDKILTLEQSLEDIKNGKLELITDAICKKFNQNFKKNAISEVTYNKYIKDNNDTTSKEFFWEVL